MLGLTKAEGLERIRSAISLSRILLVLPVPFVLANEPSADVVFGVSRKVLQRDLMG